MQWLNYHHLLYFWTVAKEGSVRRASEVLHLSQPALSTQIRALETQLGERLFNKEGRGLRLTDVGRTTYRYADEIFTLGRELLSELQGKPTGRPMRLVVGVSDALPKLMVHRLLRPALEMGEPLRLSCRENSLPDLLHALREHEVDLVLSDLPCSPSAGPKAFNHLLGECSVEVFAAPALLKQRKQRLPDLLDGAPVLLPGEGSALRRALEGWFEKHGIRPVVAGDFDDSALLKTFGAAGEGFFVAPSTIAEAVAQTYHVRRLGPLEGLKERVYAVTAERKLIHPAVRAILDTARQHVFA